MQSPNCGPWCSHDQLLSRRSGREWTTHSLTFTSTEARYPSTYYPVYAQRSRSPRFALFAGLSGSKPGCLGAPGKPSIIKVCQNSRHCQALVSELGRNLGALYVSRGACCTEYLWVIMVSRTHVPSVYMVLRLTTLPQFGSSPCTRQPSAPCFGTYPTPPRSR